jgi:phosphate transport system permease protein
MERQTRRILDHAFSAAGILAIAVMAAILIIILGPIFKRGLSAIVFRATVEHRRVMAERFDSGSISRLNAELDQVANIRKPIYEMIEQYEATELNALRGREKRDAKGALHDLQEQLFHLLGPAPGACTPLLPRQQYGQTRWDQAQLALEHVLMVESWDYGDGSQMGVLVKRPRKEAFAGSCIEPLFDYLEEHIEEMLHPRLTFYWGFLTQKSVDAHFFGGILPEMAGTFYLTIGAMLFAVPLGIIAAIYFAEYAKPGRIVNLLRSCVSTLAGVPSIVFGLFGLAFFINTLGVSDSKSVLAGALTLALLILPTVIRSAEEAILAVPRAYREASMGLGASRWRTTATVVLPAALPGILTGTVISMGRAAGETAPIIFTAAVSVGQLLTPMQLANSPTPALSWNIYNLCTEHEAVDEIRHVQYGMVMVLILIVLALNATAIIMRGRISKKLRG